MSRWQLDNVAQPMKPAVPSIAEAWIVVAAAVAALAAVSAAVGASEA